MPELPEVETVRRGLEPVLTGAVIDHVEARRPDLRFPLPEDFAARLAGRRITALGRRAKYLLADLDDGMVLVMHLGMSGSFRVVERVEIAPGDFHHPRGKIAAHDHIVFALSSGARVIYNDPRRFGFMTLVPRETLQAHPLFSHLGIEPLGNRLDGQSLAAMLAGRRANLKAALMDQRLVAGLGNIYVCEALHRAALSPRRTAATLARADGGKTVRAERLAEAIRAVLEDAVRAGGSSLRDHVQANGELGYFQHSFRVYDREGAQCPRAGCGGTIERFVQSGRSTFFCRVCQR